MYKSGKRLWFIHLKPFNLALVLLCLLGHFCARSYLVREKRMENPKSWVVVG